MTAGIFEEIISRLNRLTKCEGRHILLFLDNAPCHPTSVIDRKEFVNADEELPSCTEPIDTDKPPWREDVRNDILEDTISDTDESSSKSSRKIDQKIWYDDEGVNNVLKELTVKSVKHTIQMTEELSEFVNYHGNEGLSNTLLKVSDILRDLKAREPQKHTLIDGYF